MLTDTDIRTLNEARTILARLEEDARKASYTRPDDDTSSPFWRSARLGALGERAEIAEHAIFQLFNCANSSGILKMSEADLHNREPEAVS